MIDLSPMPLDEYRRKRDFAKTPEPSGRTAPHSSTARRFCVQKHLASHLHYDLRLEHNGVLLSWAIPKGPSLDSRDKRMAVSTEDHPLAYGTFEGVIPEGYGAGIVMLWDQGTWEPEVEDIDAALEKGDLKFSLDGFKLKGSWVLVRTRDRPNTSQKQRGRNWLLIKHRDFWSGPIDIADFAPLSVKSEGDFDDILADEMPDVWITDRPATATGGAAQSLMRETIARAAEKILTRQTEQTKKTKKAATKKKTPAKRRARR